MVISTCIFDAYGTLFDVNAAARDAAAAPGNEVLAKVWPSLAADWRAKQLQYTWLRAVAGEHIDFWQVTQDGLDWAMEAAGLGDATLREQLLALYWELPAYGEVPDMLAALKAAGLATGILSNGSPDMLASAVKNAALDTVLDDVFSVDEIRTFKTAPEVYEMVTTAYRLYPEAISFQSSNRWDVAGATKFGFRTIWINRARMPDEYLDLSPSLILPDLNAVT